MIKRLLKIVRGVVITLVVVYGLAVALLSLPWVQHHVSVAVERELSRMLDTRVAIGHITFGYPNRVIMDDVEMDDREGNELMKAARMAVRFEWMPLLRHGRISMHTVQLFGLHAHISRPTPDEELNMQFLIDALASKDTTAKTPLDLRINSLLVRRCHVKYDVKSEAQTPGVWNPHHLSVNNINATIALKALNADSINAQVKRLDLNEQSGFRLEGLEMRLLANRHHVRLEDFDMQLSKSRIRFDAISAVFPTTDGSEPFIIEGRTENSYLTPSDVASLVPALQHFDETLHLSASIRGKGRQWQSPSLRMYTQKRQVTMELDGVALHLPADTTERAYVKAEVKHLQVTPEGIPLLWHNLQGDDIPVPEMLTNVQHVLFDGDVEGTIDDLRTRGHLATGIGEVVADARLHTSGERVLTCEGYVKSDSLDMHTLLGNEQKLGVVAMNLEFKGQQAPHVPANLYLKGDIPTLHYSGYEYRHIELDGLFKENSFDGLLALSDPNVALQMDGHFSINGGIPTFDLMTRIDHFRPHDLKLTTQREGYEYAAVLKAHFSGNNINNFEGSLSVDSLWAHLPNDTFFMPQFAIRAENIGEGERLMTIASEAVQARIEGRYSYKTLPNSFGQIVAQYLPSVFEKAPTKRDEADNEFTFDIRLTDSKLYPYVIGLPLKIHPAATMKGFISNKDERVEIACDVPNLTYNDEEYEIGKIRCYNSPDNIMANFSIAKHMATGSRVALMVDAQATNDTLNATLSWGNDSPNTYAGNIDIETFFGKTSGKNTPLKAEVNIKSSEIIINDTVWDVAASTVRLDSGYVDIQGLGIRHGNQFLSVNGRLTDKASDSLIVDLSRMSVEYILDVVRFKAVKFSGLATGKVRVDGVLGDMQAHTDLHVEDFRFNHGLMGDMDVNARWDDEVGVVLDADIREADSVAHTTVEGFISPQQKGLDLQIGAHNTSLAFLNSFIGGIFADVTGRATGDVRLHGSFKELNLEGKAIASASLKPHILNTPFRIMNDSVILTTEAIEFPNVKAFDPDGNPVRLNGELSHHHLKDMGYDFNINIDRACFYDTDDFGGMPFYGKIYGSGDVHLYGGGNMLNVDGNVTTERGTLFVFNMSEPDALTDNHFITFIDRTPRPQHVVVDNLRLFQRTQDTADEEGTPLQVAINANIDATTDADVRVIMNMRTGEHIAANGEGNIQVAFTNENTTLRGNYVIGSGQYKMLIQDVIHKDFQLQQGSEVVFTGNGGEAELNLKAVHTVNSASLSDLVPDATFNQNTVKVNCVINMSGNLDNPTLDFDLELPTVNEEERQLVRSAISTDEQMRRQIIYLLVVGKFYTYDYSAPEDRQSSDAMTSLLSSTLSGQLNNLLAQALNVSNWNFSSNFSTGQEGWSDLEVEGILSGRLLDNRLLINGNFGYRENEMRNSNFVGDLDLQYLFTENLRFKAYNMTNDRYFAKQTFNTQGIGFIFKREFDNWRNFFKLRKK